MAGRIENLKPWPKGISGNPGGRPKRDLSSEIAQAVFENNPAAIFRAMTRALCKGDARIFKALADRAYGKIKETAERDASETVERLLAGRQRALESLSHEELQEQRLQLRRQLGISANKEETQ